jgi:hypothetical protein
MAERGPFEARALYEKVFNTGDLEGVVMQHKQGRLQR